MALTTCSECKAQISTQADACPSCGAKVPRTSSVAKTLAGLLALGAVLAIIGAMSGGDDTRPSASAELRAVDAKFEAEYQAKIAADSAKRAQDFAANRKTIIAKVQALSRAGKWEDAYQAANDYFDVDDAELQKLKTIADDKRSAVAVAQARAAAKKSGVSVGMTKEQVVGSSWGRPEKINTTSTATRNREQWVYGSGNYLYFEHDTLVSIQTSR